MRGRIISSLCCCIFLCSFTIPEEHAIYISVISIEHHEASHLAKIHFKIFSDDLHDAIRIENEHLIPYDSILTHEYQLNIKEYLNQHFKLTINKKVYDINELSSTMEGEALFIEAHFSTLPEWQTVSIHTDILLDIFPTQQNIVQIEHGGLKKFAKLSLNKTEAIFQF